MTLHRAIPGDTDRDTVSIIKNFLSAEAFKDIAQTMAKHVNEPVKSRVRGEAVRQLAALWGVTKSHIYAVAKNATPGVAITEAPEAPEAGFMVDSFTEDTMSGISIQASQSDEMADLLLLQVRLVGWAKQNEDERIQLQELAWKVSQTIEALEQARYVAQIEFDKSDLQSQLDGANAQVASLKAIIDRDREATRRRENPETHGE